MTDVDAGSGNEAFYGIKRDSEAVTDVDAGSGNEAFYGIKN